MNPARTHLCALSAIAVVACAQGPSAPPRMQAASAIPVLGPGVSARLLAVHNRERAALRLSPLVWDEAMAQSARSYAAQLARSGALRHSDRRARPGQGENLWMGTAGGFTIEQIALGWASEKRYFHPGIFPAVSRTRNWADVGHYSQMVWPTTRRLGCGLASAHGRDALVCRYFPAGNTDGRRVP